MGFFDGYAFGSLRLETQNMPMARRLGPGMLGHTGFTGRNWKLHEIMVGTCGTFVLETSTQQGDSSSDRRKTWSPWGPEESGAVARHRIARESPTLATKSLHFLTAERWMISNSCSKRPVTSGYIRCVSEYLQVVYCPDVLDILINDVKYWYVVHIPPRFAPHALHSTLNHTHTTHLKARITVLLAHNNRTACIDSTCSICIHLLYLLNITELHVAQMIPKDTKGWKHTVSNSIKHYQTVSNEIHL